MCIFGKACASLQTPPASTSLRCHSSFRHTYLTALDGSQKSLSRRRPVCVAVGTLVTNRGEALGSAFAAQAVIASGVGVGLGTIASGTQMPRLGTLLRSDENKKKIICTHVHTHFRKNKIHARTPGVTELWFAACAHCRCARKGSKVVMSVSTHAPQMYPHTHHKYMHTRTKNICTRASQMHAHSSSDKRGDMNTPELRRSDTNFWWS